MPIDRKNKRIFIHAPKCAGTTMAMVMGMRAEGQSGHTEDMEHLYGIHKDGNVMQCLCLKFYDNYLSDELIKSCFIFGVSRNPYDRALSDYSWKSRGCESLEEFLLLVKDTLHTHTDEELMKFDENRSTTFLPQHKFFESEKYNMDVILKFENLEEDFSKYIDNNISLGRYNQSKHRPWSEVFSNKPECIKLVNEIYKKDFEMFGYEMLHG